MLQSSDDTSTRIAAIGQVSVCGDRDLGEESANLRESARPKWFMVAWWHIISSTSKKMRKLCHRNWVYERGRYDTMMAIINNNNNNDIDSKIVVEVDPHSDRPISVIVFVIHRRIKCSLYSMMFRMMNDIFIGV